MIGEVVLERDLPRRVVVVGDLNGQGEILARILRGLRLVKRDGSWSGGKTVFVQIGDIPNRGNSARGAMELLLGLAPQAREAGGDVLWLLGNHEVLTALRHEAYVTPEEYLEFAHDEEIEQFYYARAEVIGRLLGEAREREVIEPIGGRLRVWEERNAPGKEAFRRALSASGHLGRAIRSLPIAVRMGPLLFVHAGLTPAWAEYGLAGLEREARATWARGPEFYEDLDDYGILRYKEGPLWHRSYCIRDDAATRKDLRAALSAMDATQMIVGHTRTDSIPGGVPGRPMSRFGGRLVMVDIAIGEPGEAGGAVVIEKGRMELWTPGGSKSRVADVRRR